MSETYMGRVTARFAPEIKAEIEGSPSQHSRYPRWVVPTFLVLGCLSAIDMIALVFAPMLGSVSIEMALGFVLAISLFGMSAAVRRVAIIRGRK